MLGRILQDKKVDVEEAKQHLPLRELQARLRASSKEPARDFMALCKGANQWR